MVQQDPWASAGDREDGVASSNPKQYPCNVIASTSSTPRDIEVANFVAKVRRRYPSE